MQVCPKCLKQFSGDSKICRDCGAILDRVESSVPEAEEQTPAIPNLSDSIGEKESSSILEELQEVAPTEQVTDWYWQCPGCQESIEGNFEICWNCGTSRDGTPSEFFTVEQPDGEQEILMEPVQNKTAPKSDPCEKCGSTKVIPNATIHEYTYGVLMAYVAGDPDAWIFKDVAKSEMRANICGNCGHVEIFVMNPAKLYEHYRNSQGDS